MTRDTMRFTVAVSVIGTLLAVSTHELHARDGGGHPSAEAEGFDAVPVEVHDTLSQDAFTLDLGARVQVRHTQQDPPNGGRTGSTAIRRGRVSVSGFAYERFAYAVQVGLAGGSARLLDANLTVAPGGRAEVWLGQGKAPFGRQQLNSSGRLQFVDRTIVDGRFSAGRQQGVALLGDLVDERLAYGLGVYDGEGINRPQNENGRFMTVARVVATPLGSYDPVESALDPVEGPRVALGFSGLRNTEGSGRDGTPSVRVHRFNTEAAFKVGGLNATGEFYREWAEPDGHERRVTDGAYGQVAFLFRDRRNELALRGALIRPDESHHPDNRLEMGIGYSRYLNQHRAKIQLDARNIRVRPTGDDHRELRAQMQLTVG